MNNIIWDTIDYVVENNNISKINKKDDENNVMNIEYTWLVSHNFVKDCCMFTILAPVMCLSNCILYYCS